MPGLNNAGALRRSRGRVCAAGRWAAVVGMLAVSLIVGGVVAVPAAAAATYRVTATIGVGNVPREVG